MIRLSLLWMLVAALMVYAWRDWFKSLCGLVLLMAVMQHPDMPKSVFGIQGLNVWNLVVLNVVLAWLAARRAERLRWDLPRHLNVLLILYIGVMVVSFLRMWMVRDRLADEEVTTAALISEYFVNTLKWFIPGALFFEGCRSRERFMWAIGCTLALYFLLALQVIKWVPLGYATSGEALEARSAKILAAEVGYHRVNLSMMLGGASWAIFCTRALTRKRVLSIALIGAAAVVLFGQSLTAGRTGYVTWAVVGLVLCGLRWRKYLLAAPLVVALVAFSVPGAVERLTKGFTTEEDPFADQDTVDEYEVTSGRNLIWPYVIEKIKERPWVGYGRLAMKTTGLFQFLWAELNEGFPHPHNAYLELLLDNGWLGFMIVIPFYLLALLRALALFRDSRSPTFVAAGGVAASLVLALLVAALGSQTFYPREGAVGMWCALGLMFRVSIQRKQALAAVPDPIPERQRPEGRGLAASQRRTARARIAPAPVRTLVGDEHLWARAS